MRKILPQQIGISYYFILYCFLCFNGAYGAEFFYQSWNPNHLTQFENSNILCLHVWELLLQKRSKLVISKINKKIYVLIFWCNHGVRKNALSSENLGYKNNSRSFIVFPLYIFYDNNLLVYQNFWLIILGHIIVKFSLNLKSSHLREQS